ncbi:MAG: hypothetical protein AAB309_01325, partial [Deltaproteobacteria bacterium]
MMKIRKWIILTMALLFFTGLFYISKPPVSNLLLKPYLEKTFSKALGIKIKIKHVDFSVAERSLDIYEVTSPSLLMIPEIHSTIELWQLFLGRPILKNARILKIKLKSRFLELASEELNFEMTPKKKGFLGTVTLKKVSFKDKILSRTTFSVAYEKVIIQIDKLTLQSPFGPLAIRASFPLSNKAQIHQARFFINDIP